VAASEWVLLCLLQLCWFQPAGTSLLLLLLLVTEETMLLAALHAAAAAVHLSAADLADHQVTVAQTSGLPSLAAACHLPPHFPDEVHGGPHCELHPELLHLHLPAALHLNPHQG
jgi:hypothetical protein